MYRQRVPLLAIVALDDDGSVTGLSLRMTSSD
jgi:hypothetical protein